MSRTTSFLLGMLCGAIALILIIAIVLYCVVAFLTPNKINPASAQYIGDLADKSLLEVYNEFMKLYNEANITKPDKDGQYFSIADFEKKYNVDFSKTLGITLTDEIKKMPVFSLFTGDGINKLLGQTSITAVSDIMKIFTGNGLFNDSALQKISKFSVKDIMSQPMTVLKSLNFGDVIKLNSTQTKGASQGLMDALITCNIGDTLETILGGGNLLLAVKNGPLSAVGALTFSQLAGSASGTFIDNMKLNEIIDNNGSVDISKLTSDKLIGELMGNTRKPISSDNIESTYPTLVGEFIKGDTTITVRKNESNYVMTNNNTDWYEAFLSCKETEHTYDCYSYKWYINTEYKEEVSSLIYKLANLSVADLSGNGFNDIINKLTIREVLGDDKVSSGILKAIADVKLSELSSTIDTLPLGSALGYERTEISDTSDYDTDSTLTDGDTIIRQHLTEADKYIKSVDGGTVWYKATLTCKDTHTTHTTRCYSHWFNAEGQSPSSYIAVIADLTFKDMTEGNALNNAINNMTFGEVISLESTSSPMLKALADTKLSEIGTAIDNMYMGTVLGLYKNPDDNQWYTDEKFENKAKPIEIKLADKKLNEINSKVITEIVQGLTIQELMTSQVLNFGPSETTKLDLIFGKGKWEGLTISKFINGIINYNPATQTSALAISGNCFA